MRNLAYLMCAMSLLLNLVSCSSESDYNDESGGISGTGVNYEVKSSGAISGFKSLDDKSAFYIGDTLYQVDVAELNYNGEVVPVSSLEVGMIIDVSGQSNPDDTSIRVSSISYNDKLAGYISQIQAINADEYSISLLKQHVIVNKNTHLQGIFVDKLQVGDYVVISGWPRQDEQWHANYIALGSQDKPLKENVEGIIAELDTVKKQFTLNQIQVSYQDATLIDVPLTNGRVVFLVGDYDANNDIFNVDRIHPANLTAFYPDEPMLQDQIFLSGLVSQLVSADQFWLNNQILIDASQATVMAPPMQGIRLGDFVEVRGRWANDKTLVQAQQINVRDGFSNFGPQGSIVPVFGRFDGYESEQSIYVGPNIIDISKAIFKPEPFTLTLGMELQINARVVSQNRLEAIDIAQAQTRPPRHH